MTETQHHALLVAAVVVALGFSTWRASRTGRWRFVAITLLGCWLLIAAHLAGESTVLTWAGIAVLLVGGWRERRRGAPLLPLPNTSAGVRAATRRK